MIRGVDDLFSYLELRKIRFLFLILSLRNILIGDMLDIDNTILSI